MKRLLFAILIVVLVLGLSTPAFAGDKTGDTTGYQTKFLLWRAAENGFAGWALNGVSMQTDGTLVLNTAAQPGSDPYAAGGYYGGNYYNAGRFEVGYAESPVLPVTFPFKEAIASWNAVTPPGTWIETLVSVQFGSRMSKEYNLGIWASDLGTVQRHSVRLQGDADGYVSVDTLVLAKGKAVPTGLQVKVRLFRAEGSTSTPVLRNLSLAYSSEPSKKVSVLPDDPAYPPALLNVPECSQMVYSDGGNVWCSPTSTSMVLGYWGTDPGPCEPRVRAAVAGVYDWIYAGHGNWPFNTAYAASRGYEAYVRRFTSLTQLEPWIASEVPVIMSIAWGKSDLDGAAVPSSNGHLVVLVGFDANGDPIVNDPAAAADADVQRTYDRTQFETIWQNASGGTVYLIYPQGQAVP